MITPRFSCSQTDLSVIISIYCPSVHASDVEIHVDGPLFTLHINPYFLRLNFSHNVIDDDASSATYDLGSGYLTVNLTKEVRGQDFKDLDLLSRLLAPPPPTNQTTIEVLSCHSPTPTSEKDEILEAARNDWRLPQMPGEPDVELSAQQHYGFLNMHDGYFRHVKHTENEVNELGADAEVCHANERRARRIRNEDRKFDGEHYIADCVDTGIIQGLLEWNHPYLSDGGEIQFTEEEKLAMIKLPRREYLATLQQTHDLYLTLVTLLFSYAYESRTTQHDPTPESAWTICSLTPAFSALDPPTTSAMDLHKFTQDEMRHTLLPSYRRSLAFPLYRSFTLTESCRRDVAKILFGGKRLVFRCLLEMKLILDHHEVYHVYSKAWLDDFCVWAQAYASDPVLGRLATCVADTQIEKSDIGWDLEDLENSVCSVLERDSDSDDEDTEE